MKFIITQIIGAIAYSLLAYSFFKEKKKQILFVQIFAYIGFTIHYMLLGAITGSICNILGFFTLILIYKFGDNEEKKKILILVLIPLLIAMTFLSYENIYSILPVFACLITFNSFLSKEVNRIRIIGIISAICWLIYAIIYVSYSAIIFEVVTVFSVTVAYIENKKH